MSGEFKYVRYFLVKFLFGSKVANQCETAFSIFKVSLKWIAVCCSATSVDILPGTREPNVCIYSSFLMLHKNRSLNKQAIAWDWRESFQNVAGDLMFNTTWQTKKNADVNWGSWASALCLLHVTNCSLCEYRVLNWALLRQQIS